jgi:hypothetical protein
VELKDARDQKSGIRDQEIEGKRNQKTEISDQGREIND